MRLPCDLPPGRTAGALVLLAGLALGGHSSEVSAQPMAASLAQLTLDHETPVNPSLQAEIAALDRRLRAARGMTAEQGAVGVFDLRSGRLALLRPDAIEYAASLPKIGILLAWFDQHRLPSDLDPVTRHELGLMIKASSNELAAKYSQAIGLKTIQSVLERHGLYDASRGGGLWVGKHYGKSTERYVDPVGGHSHAATVRQLLRFYLWLEQGRLISPVASAAMREIFASPDIPALDDKFVRGLAGRDLVILRKSGWWEAWFHDTAIIRGANRHYLLVALTHHPKGEDYLEALAPAVDDLLGGAR